MLYLMVGRPIKVYSLIHESLTLSQSDGTVLHFGDILIFCPICRSSLVGTYGYQDSKTGSHIKYQCKNPACPALRYLRRGKQFTLRTSALFQETLAKHVIQIVTSLIQGDTTQIAVGQRYHRSPALMTIIRHKAEKFLDERKDLDNLVREPAMEQALSLDEMFLKIEGEQIYVIPGTCYGKKKVLGVKVATSRDDTIMRSVFDEAERNNGKPFEILTIDAWGGSIKMAKELGRPIIVVIHKHKAPYDKAVIWKIEYIENKRIIHKIGLQTDFFLRRKTRVYYYLREEEDLTSPPPKKKGRRKGVKNGQGKGPYKKVPKNKQKTRGPKGIFTVFGKGKKYYARVDPGKRQIKLSKGGSSTVGAVLNQVIQVFTKMTIQNNLAENKNSVIEHRVWRSGPKLIAGFEKRIRTFLFYLNNPDELMKLKIDHQLRGDLVYTELKTGLYGQIFLANQKSMQNLMKMGVLN
jgi:hypothetical protein